MSKDGSLTLSDIRVPHLWLVCESCGRRGRFNVARLMQEHGDARLTDLRLVLANCHRGESHSVHDVCKAVYSPIP